MQKVDIAELRRLLADDAPIRWAQNAAAVWNALPALLDELEAAQEEVRRQGSVIAECGEEVRRLTQANADLRKERDRAVAEAQRQDSVAKGLRKERDQLSAHVERLRAALDRAFEGAARQLAEPRHHGNDQYALTDIATTCELALAATPAQSIAAHDAALLRRLAAESAPGERADIAPWLLAEADRIEKEAANGKTGS